MDLKKEIVNILLEAKDEIISNIDTEGIRASGRTQQSLKVVEYENGVQLVGGGGDAASIESLQYGWKPEKIPDDIPKNFVEILVKWIEDKQINVKQVPYKRKPSANWQPKYTVEERSKRIAAASIANHIKNFGTLRYRNNNLNVYTPIVEKVKEKVSKIVLASIRESLK